MQLCVWMVQYISTPSLQKGTLSENHLMYFLTLVMVRSDIHHDNFFYTYCVQGKPVHLSFMTLYVFFVPKLSKLAFMGNCVFGTHLVIHHHIVYYQCVLQYSMENHSYVCF